MWGLDSQGVPSWGLPRCLRARKGRPSQASRRPLQLMVHKWMPVSESLPVVDMWLWVDSVGSSGSNSHNWTPEPEACGQEKVG